MYSRYSNRPAKHIQIPEHYSGCAFSESPREDAPARFLEVAKPTPRESEGTWSEENSALSAPLPPPIQEEATPHAPLSNEDDTAPPPAKEASAHPALPAPFQSLFGPLGSALPFSKGLDFDQLLILGLILLLLHNEQDADIVLWLGLLLLCG